MSAYLESLSDAELRELARPHEDELLKALPGLVATGQVIDDTRFMDGFNWLHSAHLTTGAEELAIINLCNVANLRTWRAQKGV